MESQNSNRGYAYEVVEETIYKERKTNRNAVIGLVLSIIGLIAARLRIVFYIAGFIFCLIGLVQIKERGERGKAYAIIGIIIDSIIFLFLLLILFGLVAISNGY